MSCVSFYHIELCKIDPTLSKSHVIRSGCAVGFKCIKKEEKQKKRGFIPVSTPLSAKKRRRGELKEEGGGEEEKASMLPPLSPSLRRRFLVLYLQKAVLSRPSGDPDGRTFHNKKVKIKPTLLTPPINKHVRDIKAEKIELGWLCSQSEREREGRPELKAFVCSFQTDLAGTPAF